MPSTLLPRRTKLGDKLVDAFAKVVAHDIKVRRLHMLRIWNRPILAPVSLQERTRVAAAHGYDRVELHAFQVRRCRSDGATAFLRK